MVHHSLSNGLLYWTRGTADNHVHYTVGFWEYFVVIVVAGIAVSDANLFVTYKDVANCTALFSCHYDTSVSNQLIEFLVQTVHKLFKFW